MEYILIAFVAFIVCVLIAAAISGIIMMVIRGSLKSVRAEKAACNYSKNGSFRLSNQNDTFLYNNVTRRPRAQQQTQQPRQTTQSPRPAQRPVQRQSISRGGGGRRR
ncbi:MAG: hypothetical protein FWC89_07550 [Defluviitaleaceae bacterium]|nr:hypothetical protein [Defluviitaleaceae bacterium]